MFQSLYIGMLPVTMLVGTPLTQNQSCSAPRNSDLLLPLDLYTSVIFEPYPIKMWVLVSPPSIAIVS